MEGHWETSRGISMLLFAIPDQAAATNRYEIGIPRLGSLILTHAWDGEVKGLHEVPAEDRPPVAIVFYAFRIMVGIGMLLAGLGLLGLWLRWRGRLYTTPLYLRLVVASSPLGFVAILAGWVVTEVGRQPWTVYGHIRTADSVSPVAAGAVASSLALFVLVYSVLVSSLPALRLARGAARAERAARGAAARRPAARRGGRRAAGRGPGGIGRGRTGARPAPDLELASSPSACSCTCCSTGSISALASCSRSPATGGAGRDDEQHRADLGRQRDLAGARRRRHAGRLSARLRDVLPALYLPLMVMLFGLIFRGVAFEFRAQHRYQGRWWDLAFSGGSMRRDIGAGHRARRASSPAFDDRDGQVAGGAFVADPVQLDGRRRPARRLRPARRHLAGHENRWNLVQERSYSQAFTLAILVAVGMGRDQRLDAAHPPRRRARAGSRGPTSSCSCPCRW